MEDSIQNPLHSNPDSILFRRQNYKLNNTEGDEDKQKDYSNEEDKNIKMIDRIILNPDDISHKTILLIGQTGVGKSSFVQKITRDLKAEIGNEIDSKTQVCNKFENNGINYIDTPGINDTKNNKYEVLLKIVKYLFENSLQLEDLFILYVSNKSLETHKIDLQEFSYTYFLYKLFEKEQILAIDVEICIKEYHLSCGLLNWQDCGFDLLKDNYSQFREKIFKNKDLALNYLQYVNSFHIVVKTHFDLTDRHELQEFGRGVDDLKEQIWSNKNENSNFYCYKDYIANQYEYLTKKINRIIHIDNQIKTCPQGKEEQFILLIGQSQIGKSSLIEQLTQFKGLRGSGNQSKTYLCQIYPYDYNNVKYQFIDTPGFGGTEAQPNYTNLKMISDYLRRNQIKEFKIIYMRDSVREKKNLLDQMIQKLYSFILYMFDQDTSLIDSDQLKDMLQILEDSPTDQLLTDRKNIDIIKQKILQVERVQERKHQQEVYVNEFQVKSVEFINNFTTTSGKLINVGEQENEDQIKTLFRGINMIDSVCVDDKIYLKMLQVSNLQIIEECNQYIIYYKIIKQKYEELNEIQLKLFPSKEQSSQSQKQNDYSELRNKKFAIKKELDHLLFAVIGNVHKSQEVNDFIRQLYANNQSLNKLQNDIQRHFLIINYPSVLFESDQNKKNVFLSRKQFYYQQLIHQLKPFIQKDNQTHRQIVEDLAKMKIIQAITLQRHLQLSIIDKFSDQNPEEVKAKIEAQISNLNLLIGTGGQIFRYSTFFCNILQKTLSERNFMQSTRFITTIIGAINIGIDIFSRLRGFNNKQDLLEIKNNAILWLLLASLTAGCGLVVGFFALIAQIRSQQKIASRIIQDQAIGLFLKSIIDEQLPNQNLLYFQKSEFLSTQFSFQNYSYLQKQQGYDMFKKIEKKNYDNQDQKNILLKLFNNPQPEDLLNRISNHLNSQIIVNQFQVDLQIQQFSQEPTQDLMRIQYQLKNNQALLNHYKTKKYEQIIISQKKIEDIITKKIENIKHSKEFSWTSEEEKVINDYQINIQKFIEQIKINSQNNATFERGFLRKSSHFPILLNSYCNLAKQKVDYLFKQDIISELEKGDQCFKEVGQYDIHNFLKLDNDYNLTIQKLSTLTMYEKYSNNRYLNKLKLLNEPNLTYISGAEILDTEVQYSHDLHQLIQDKPTYENFKNRIQEKTKNEFKITEQINQRLHDFYDSAIYLFQQFS